MIKTQNDNISLKLCLFHENREHFVSKHGEAACMGKVNDLVSKLPDPIIDELERVTNPSNNGSKEN